MGFEREGKQQRKKQKKGKGILILLLVFLDCGGVGSL